MERLERVQRITYRRMGQVNSELERFEERPELQRRGRYGSLRKRLVSNKERTTCKHESGS
jgi:hypothetical protein